MVALDVSGHCGSMIAIGLPDPCELPVVGVHANHKLKTTPEIGQDFEHATLDSSHVSVS